MTADVREIRCIVHGSDQFLAIGKQRTDLTTVAAWADVLVVTEAIFLDVQGVLGIEWAVHQHPTDPAGRNIVIAWRRELLWSGKRGRTTGLDKVPGLRRRDIIWNDLYVHRLPGSTPDPLDTIELGRVIAYHQAPKRVWLYAGPMWVRLRQLRGRARRDGMPVLIGGDANRLARYVKTVFRFLNVIGDRLMSWAFSDRVDATRYLWTGPDLWTGHVPACLVVRVHVKKSQEGS